MMSSSRTNQSTPTVDPKTLRKKLKKKGEVRGALSFPVDVPEAKQFIERSETGYTRVRNPIGLSQFLADAAHDYLRSVYGPKAYILGVRTRRDIDNATYEPGVHTVPIVAVYAALSPKRGRKAGLDRARALDAMWG